MDQSDDPTRTDPWASVDATGRPSTTTIDLPDPDPVSPTRTRPEAYLVEQSEDR